MAFKNYDSSGNVLSRSLTDLPVGTVVSTALSAAPYGWLICDGTAVSRTSYPELFGALGTGYGAGDASTTFNVPNSDGQMILAISTAQRIGVAMPPQFVTTLPSSPIDGTEVYYQSTTAGTGGGATNSMADVGAVWHLRYRAASSSAYKWEFVGGGRTAHSIDGGEARASAGTFGDLATVGPSLVVPVAGTYEVLYGCRSNADNANRNIAVEIAKNGTQVEFAYVAANDSATDGASGASANVVVELTLAASDALKLRYYSSASTTPTFSNRRIRLLPIRVSA